LNNKIIAKRYAQALIQIAEENNALELYEKELKEVISVINDNPDLYSAWNSKRVISEKKKEIISEAFRKKVCNNILHFLFLLIDKRRETYLFSILKEYGNMSDTVRNIINADVRTAVQLTDKDFHKLKAKLSAMTGKNVRLRVHIDPTLIGGLVVKIGDQVIDGSVIKRLAILKKRIINNKLSKIGVSD